MTAHSFTRSGKRWVSEAPRLAWRGVFTGESTGLTMGILNTLGRTPPRGCKRGGGGVSGVTLLLGVPAWGGGAGPVTPSPWG